MELKDFISNQFGVKEDIFLEALTLSPSSQGYIMGAISEILLRNYLHDNGYETKRIKEKPSGGNNAKSSEARGDFYIRKKDNPENGWLVIESKGLKSNSEFRGSKLDSKEKLFRFLKPKAFPEVGIKEKIFLKGKITYSRAKDTWEKDNAGKTFPPFNWNADTPGPDACNVRGLWKDEQDLKDWIDSQTDESFAESAYRKLEGPIVILETHQPSNREAPITGIGQAAPLVIDFNIMAVDLFLRTKKHEFVFMNATHISHSPTSPEHLYQNYTIDILVKGKKEELCITSPWYSDLDQCIDETNPSPRELDESQLDNRTTQEISTEIIAPTE